ncbi:phosphotransferase family protein [Shinella zoogloeoides]|jgi:Ser/Thr protein kinase RdoA (MazF antagonist)|uniref:phosphotransferase family protein n=1 Tax=Shinella zoogloeoides TaxID=352475 RepID=UPI00273D52A3|nr:aminoglycoside phosphotransferase family protein [Shinella zoogloeoides]WLR92632.1 aminoglycoside phosphotransferase family protein [Shinella zoogloeoides]
MASEPDLSRAAILAVHPELADAAFRPLPGGWHSRAVAVDDRLVFKFPQGEEAEQALRREASILAAVRPHLSMRVPDLRLHDGTPLFSEHAIIPGEHLETAQYQALPEPARQALGAAMARFHAELHALDRTAMARAGARPVERWLGADDIAAKALPLLPEELHAFARKTIADWRALPPDPHGETYGFFDGHGWNMAFDHAAGRLNGVYDFADSGFGPLHQDFIYSNFIDPDLTARIVDSYEQLTGRPLDRARIHLLTGVHRLWELAALADTPEHHATMIASVAAWAGRQ